MDASIVFARWRQCAPPSNTCFLGPTQVHTPNDISAGSAVFAKLMSECPCTLQLAAPFHPLKIALVHGGSGPPSNACFFGLSPLRIPNGISISSAVFAQLTADSHYTLQWATCLPLKIIPSNVDIWIPSNTWFLCPTQVLNSNSIAIG